ncbi:Late IMV membrane protein [Sea otter poxvirus]|uniref:Late IMV membrane protein n=1 Tax=Sea otter poxvirus TaxID=1416741 RepID=A0A2U9QHP4_9POXV|nr:Late IMV membrane protein [Sea otter poxvirus]AWU47113.1 Late IMV membrane protein [Sea otter poxvirus]
MTTTHKTDAEIYAFCDKNPTDIKCKCLNPTPTIIKIGKETRLPYYCWYEPCKKIDALLPSFLRKNIARCNVSDCNISLGQVTINNGNINIYNICGSKISTTQAFSARYLNQDILYPIVDPVTWMPLALIAFSSVVMNAYT